ncbi:MAG TPA: zf-HC2 domain-containing protein [Vicinamibacterales bacterium]|nr:zf-HC2 domain-containing protein [Vicinamibacterales bacterium]
MHEEWTDKLSDYLDDELSPEERYAVESHLLGCAACTEVLNDLKRVVARAQSLDVRPPQADLWAGIRRRTEAIRQPRRVTVTVWQAIAASVMIALLSGAVVWQALGRPTGLRYNGPAPADVAQGSSPASDRAERKDVVVPVSYADAQYDAAVADLQKTLNDNRKRLDKTTVAIVEHNLQLIDQAIEQARQALEADPANDYLSSHLVEARRRKLDLLRRATELAEAN